MPAKWKARYVEELMKLKRTRLAPGSSESTSNQATSSARNSPMSAITSPSNHGRGAYGSVPENDRPTGDFPSEVTVPRLHPPVLRFSAPSPTFPGATLSSEKLLACHKYSRAVRVLAVLDAVVVLYGASAFTPLILMIWGPIAGYVSSTFRLRAANAFLFYYGLRVCWDIGWLLSGGITWIVVWVFLVTNAAASGLVYLYVVLLRKCTPSEIVQLRDPNASWTSAFFPFVSPTTISSNSSIP